MPKLRAGSVNFPQRELLPSSTPRSGLQPCLSLLGHGLLTHPGHELRQFHWRALYPLDGELLEQRLAFPDFKLANRRIEKPRHGFPFVLQSLCWLLWASVRKIGLLRTMLEAFLQSTGEAHTINTIHAVYVLRPCAHFHREEVLFVRCMFPLIKQCVSFCFHELQEQILRWMKPRTASFVLGTLADLTKGKAELLAENALLRHQLIILRRQVKRPVCRKTDRLLLVLLARMAQTWKEALFLVQPETILRWHRELFCLFWKHKSKVRSRKPRISPEAIRLIKEMAANNRLWEQSAFMRLCGHFLEEMCAHITAFM